jgi:adenosylcobyric acid synthase
MSLNSWVTRDGGEIGIAQAVQAAAARIEPTVDMNPILLKPKGRNISQVVVRGKPYADAAAGSYYNLTPKLLLEVKKSLEVLEEHYDAVIMEGAGGAAEINLYDRDIANIGMARLTKAPILLIADIDRGGVFASIYGTVALLPDDVRTQVRGVVINKFRGDERLLEDGIKKIEELINAPVLGILPYVEVNLPSEDSVSLEDKTKNAYKGKEHTPAAVEIAVVKLPHISNFTDFEPLEHEPGVGVRYVSLRERLGRPDALILPGTKNTVDDLLALRQAGMDEEISRLAEDRVPVVGICGGFQMLGREVIDAGIESVESVGRTIKGLGLLNAATRFERYEKKTEQVERVIKGRGPILGRLQGQKVFGYEIHMGATHGDEAQVFEGEGQVNREGLVWGTYLHGLFWNKNLREAFLDYLFKQKGLARAESDSPGGLTSDPYDAWAAVLQKHVNVGFILDLLGVHA